MKLVAAFGMLFGAATAWAGAMPPVQTVFIIVLENHDWVDFRGSTNAPYLNNTLLPMAAYCEGYYNPPGLHPSLPNYLWFEAGTNFGILDDRGPASGHQNSTNHLVTLLNSAGISWKAYQEDISGTTVPLDYTNAYAPRHNPFVYFDDVTGTNNPNYPYGIAHIRPYSEFASNLTNNTVARYNFITPNLCNDGHDSCAPLYNPVRQSDSWLAAEIPKILNSHTYQNGGALFITWDESDNVDGPIGMVVLSPLARGGGYTNHIQYTHSSLLRTFQEIFGVRPWLGDAANATDLSELFCPFELRNVTKLPNGAIQLTAIGVIPGWTSVIEASVDLVNWTPISTNVPGTNSFNLIDQSATNLTSRFYRIHQRPP
jgi:hypothetical protein